MFLVLGRSFSCSDVDVAVGETTEEKEDTPPCLATTMEPAFNGAATRRGQMLLDHLRFYVTRFCSASLSLSLSLAQRPPPLCQRLDLHVSCVANTFLHPAQCVRLGVFFCFFFFGGCFPGPAFESSRHRPTFTAVFYYFAVGVEDRDRQTERERERDKSKGTGPYRRWLSAGAATFTAATKDATKRAKPQKKKNQKKTQKKLDVVHTHTNTERKRNKPNDRRPRFHSLIDAIKRRDTSMDSRSPLPPRDDSQQQQQHQQQHQQQQQQQLQQPTIIFQ